MKKITFEEWREQHPEVEYEMVWAEDTEAGFGKKGWTVYGDGVGLYIHHITVSDSGKCTLHMWMDGLREIPDWEEPIMTIAVGSQETVRVFKHGDDDFSVSFEQGNWSESGTAEETWLMIGSIVANAMAFGNRG